MLSFVLALLYLTDCVFNLMVLSCRVLSTPNRILLNKFTYLLNFVSSGMHTVLSVAAVFYTGGGKMGIPKGLVSPQRY